MDIFTHKAVFNECCVDFFGKKTGKFISRSPETFKLIPLVLKILDRLRLHCVYVLIIHNNIVLILVFYRGYGLIKIFYGSVMCR